MAGSLAAAFTQTFLHNKHVFFSFLLKSNQLKVFILHNGSQALQSFLRFTVVTLCGQ